MQKKNSHTFFILFFEMTKNWQTVRKWQQLSDFIEQANILMSQNTRRDDLLEKTKQKRVWDQIPKFMGWTQVHRVQVLRYTLTNSYCTVNLCQHHTWQQHILYIILNMQVHENTFTPLQAQKMMTQMVMTQITTGSLPHKFLLKPQLDHYHKYVFVFLYIYTFF